jgi:hypothetical protein
MTLWQRLFANKLDHDFDRTLSTKIKIHDRVRHRDTREPGTVIQTCNLSTHVAEIPAVTVRYDNGQVATLLPAEEFTKWTRY